MTSSTWSPPPRSSSTCTDPERALAEMARVAGRHLLVSVPHEPLWRALNMARGAYLRELGNTPGHLNHWTRRSFVGLLGRYGEVVQTRVAVPVDDAAGASARVSRLRRRHRVALGGGDRAPGSPRRPATAAGRSRGRRRAISRSPPGARILTIGIASTGIFTFAYLATASHVLGAGRLQPHLAVLGGHVRDPVGDLPPDRAAALAARSPTAAPAGCAVTRCGSRRRSSSGSRLVFLVVALALRHQIQQGMFDGSSDAVLDPGDRGAGLRRQLLRPRLAGRPSALRALRRPGLPGVDRPLPVPAGGRRRDRLGPGHRRAGHGGGAVRVAVGDAAGVPARSGRPPRRPGWSPPMPAADAAAEGPAQAQLEEAGSAICRCATAPASPSRSSGSCSPSRC